MSLTKDDIDQVRDVVVSAIEALVIPRFDEHDKRFDALEKRFDSLEERVDALANDVVDLKKDMREAKNHLANIEGRLEALEADIKELYGMVEKIQRHNGARKSFDKLSFEQKTIQVYEDIRALAQEAGIALPE
jgi:chromosome segregation ATPase